MRTFAQLEKKNVKSRRYSHSNIMESYKRMMKIEVTEV